MEDLHKSSEDKLSDEESLKKKTKKIGAAAVEARPLAGPQKALEHIGQMLLNGETKPAANAAKPAERRPRAGADKRAETLSRAELLKLSETIAVDGSNLRQIYETHLVGERGLRRLVSEYLRGGDLKKSLRLEVIEREIDFERDPGLRDMTPDQPAVSGNASKATLDELLQKATVANGDDDEETAFFKARANYEANQLVQHKQQRRLADTGFAIAITVLLALVIFLYLSRK
jgi:hypothetical protein